jgi:hypothetical protein
LHLFDDNYNLEFLFWVDLMAFTFRTTAALAAFAGLLTGAPAADAGPIVATYEAAGVETPDAAAICGSTAGCTVGYETFNYVTQAQASQGYTSNYSSGTGVASPYSGTYSPFVLQPADQYGGAGGIGTYPEVYGSSSPASYSIKLTNNNTGGGVNYFGMWISALDASNQLMFYDANGNLLLDFTSQQLIGDLGNCNNGHAGNAYCGNPSDYYADSGELFAYVNFFDTSGTFSKVVVSEAGGAGAGFESDNHAVAYNQNLTPSGNAVVSEPASLAIMGIGLMGLCLARRRPRQRRVHR